MTIRTLRSSLASTLPLAALLTIPATGDRRRCPCRQTAAMARMVIDTATAGVAGCEWWVGVHQGPANTSPQTPAVATGPVTFVEAGHVD